VENSDFIFQHGHPQTAENSLENHAGDREQTKRFNRLSIFGSPNPDRENDCEKSNR